jgi:hypothetical protein
MSVGVSGLNADTDAFFAEINDQNLTGPYRVKRRGHQLMRRQRDGSPTFDIALDTDRLEPTDGE